MTGLTSREPFSDGTHDLISTALQGVIWTHGPLACQDRPCIIHNPTDHHMMTWPVVFNPRLAYAGFRVCEHDHEHPDPDSLAYFATKIDADQLRLMRTHCCDGCCHQAQA